MEFAVVVTMGGVVAENVAIATLQFFVEGGFVDCSGPDVVGQDTANQTVTTHVPV